MTKELEYIQRQINIVKQQVKGSKIKFTVTDAVTKHQYDYYERELQTIESIEQALQRLEAIDNANPSEALECLEKLKGMEISSMPFSDEYGTQEVDLNDIRKVGSQLNTDFREYTATIKQALLKQQELPEPFKTGVDIGVIKPKHYLKWEDLEFSVPTSLPTTIKVKMGDTQYLLCLRTSFSDVKSVVLRDTDLKPILHIYEEEKQLFNDLHLERVEE